MGQGSRQAEADNRGIADSPAGAQPPSSAAGMGIYCIRNKINGRIYIGSSLNVAARWETHRKELNAGKRAAPRAVETEAFPPRVRRQIGRRHLKGIGARARMQNDWFKYGASVFEINILEVVSQRSLLASTEEKWIAKCDAAREPNYNATPWSTRDDAWEKELLGEYCKLEFIEIRAPDASEIRRFRRMTLLSELTFGFIPRPTNPEAIAARAREAREAQYAGLADRILRGELHCPLAEFAQDQVVTLVKRAIDVAWEREMARERAEKGFITSLAPPQRLP